MNTENMIEVTNMNLVKLVQNAYLLSHPQGMGFLHCKNGDDLTNEEALTYINKDKDLVVVSMDYVRGRSCKFRVMKDKETDKLYIMNSWYDHSDDDLKQLLKQSG